MKEIPLEDGGTVKVDDEDYEWLRHFTWNGSAGYARCYQGGRALLMHRLLANVPDEWEVHHKDTDPFNNQRDNLVPLTPAAHKAEHGGPRPRKRRGPLPDSTVRIHDVPFDWSAVDEEYSERGL